MSILNLTQHTATNAQIEAGVVEPDKETKAEVKKLLTFDELPNNQEVVTRASKIAAIAKNGGYNKAMIGGAPYLMPQLHYELTYRAIQPLYAFTKREVVEKDDGKKISKFTHKGFVVL